MKKSLTLSSILLFLASFVATAVPSSREKFLYRQPDGTVLLLQNHGDEFFHWTTDESGRILEKESDGYYRLVGSELHKARLRRASVIKRWSSYDRPPVTNFGDRKILCILANFSDSTFVIDNPKDRFSRMLNEVGYSDNGAIGSVRDYYVDNSQGEYRPQFDVYGPVNLSESSAYYDSHGPYRAIREAYELLADQIPIDDYDTDGDGAVDMVLFYYPGHNEAEGGGTESIWPHQSSGGFGYLGEKRFNRYFCTSELRGARGSEMCSIGTTCHEFAHSLGLPDFYDTDYEKNGENSTTEEFDLMSSGGYNDRGRKPPYLNAVECNMLGWMPDPELLTDGSYSLPPIRENVAYLIESETEGEYFVLECRDNYKWDGGFRESGLLVYHIDKSSNLVAQSGKTAAQLWNGNAINAFGGHPCFYLVQAVQDSYYAFPGRSGITTYLPKDWEGSEAGTVLTDIAYNGRQATFNANVSPSGTSSMLGHVYNSAGVPLKGVQVILTESAISFAPSPHGLSRHGLSRDVVAVTGDDGRYQFKLSQSDASDQILTVLAEGYVPVSLNLSIDRKFFMQDFILFRHGEGEHEGIRKYDPSLINYSAKFALDCIAVGPRFSAGELSEMGACGSRVTSVSFLASPSSWDQVYVVIDAGDERLLLKNVTDQFTSGAMVTVDLADEDVVIPEGKDVYIGYGLSGMEPNSYSINMYGSQKEDTDGTWYSSSFLDGSNWTKRVFGQRYFSFIVSAEISHPKDMDFSELGLSFIRLTKDGAEVVATTDRTVSTVEWFLDGEAVSTPPARSSLSAGSHTYMVRLTYYDGTMERVYLDVD